MLSAVEVSLPPLIADRSPALPSRVVTALDEATREITALDRGRHAANLQALAGMLMRTESVASSRIERVVASVGDYARAMHGSKANSSAVSMVAATDALHDLMAAVTDERRVTLDMLTSAHRRLMRDDPNEAEYAGRVRDVQNWIGGSDHSPRGALYVPPPPEAVDRYLDDALAFTSREDIPALAQAAIVHAQFESIHPFTDGNGRIGRALVNAVLRRRGATSAVVVPIASALVVRRARYFDLLDLYRRGDIVPIVHAFAQAGRVAAEESLMTAERLGVLPERWCAQVGRVRSGSVTARLLDRIASAPVFAAEDAVREHDAPTSGVYDAIGRLADAGVLEALTESKRNRVWAAVDVLDEIEDLGIRIELAARRVEW